MFKIGNRIIPILDKLHVVLVSLFPTLDLAGHFSSSSIIIYLITYLSFHCLDVTLTKAKK